MRKDKQFSPLYMEGPRKDGLMGDKVLTLCKAIYDGKDNYVGVIALDVL